MKLKDLKNMSPSEISAYIQTQSNEYGKVSSKVSHNSKNAIKENFSAMVAFKLIFWGAALASLIRLFPYIKKLIIPYILPFAVIVVSIYFLSLIIEYRRANHLYFYSLKNIKKEQKKRR